MTEPILKYPDEDLGWWESLDARVKNEIAISFKRFLKTEFRNTDSLPIPIRQVKRFLKLVDGHFNIVNFFIRVKFVTKKKCKICDTIMTSRKNRYCQECIDLASHL